MYKLCMVVCWDPMSFKGYNPHCQLVWCFLTFNLHDYPEYNPPPKGGGNLHVKRLFNSWLLHNIRHLYLYSIYLKGLTTCGHVVATFNFEYCFDNHIGSCIVSSSYKLQSMMIVIPSLRIKVRCKSLALGMLAKWVYTYQTKWWILCVENLL